MMFTTLITAIAIAQQGLIKRDDQLSTTPSGSLDSDIGVAESTPSPTDLETAEEDTTIDDNADTKSAEVSPSSEVDDEESSAEASPSPDVDDDDESSAEASPSPDVDDDESSAEASPSPDAGTDDSADASTDSDLNTTTTTDGDDAQ